ncbi:MAG: response regulator [Labilithrix sp.]|nr:response regulator [Labilithrix sp.]MCW5810940.1 response regulator [Labilithrix sp.]
MTPTPTEQLILYVDDEHANRVVFQATFGKKFKIKAVASAEEALDFCAKTHEPVAVIVSDQRMTGMSGDELLRRVKDVSPDTVRMILTAYSDLEPILGAVNEGLVARYVIKPWDRTELEETLRWALEAFVAGRQNNALQLRLVQTERLRTLGQVSAAVLHDLNQPVMAVSMSAEQLSELSKVAPALSRIANGDTKLTEQERSTLAALGEELPDLASNLASCATFMTDLMKQMRQFQRHDTAPPTSGDVAPGPVLKLALSMCRSGGIAGGSKLVFEGPSDLPRVRATSTDLLQVIVNLIRNAQQALEEHHVREGVVRIHTAVADGFLTVSVHDNGPGIPPDVLSKLGTPFYTTRDAGTGLGIAQCKRLVGRLGGDLRIESTLGTGTDVTFTLPVFGATH